MLILSPGETGNFEFIFNQNGSFYDPTLGATPSDVIISVYRGDLGAGPIIDGPYSYIMQGATVNSNYIEKTSNNTLYYGNYGDTPGNTFTSHDIVKFTLHYTVPENIFPGNYSVVASTYYEATVMQYTAQFQVPQQERTTVSSFSDGNKGLSTSFVPSFDSLDQYKTNSILLIGHADGLELNSVRRIRSIQEGIDLLNADYNSPLLRGIFDAYAHGARDIYICAAAPMKEYEATTEARLSKIPMYTYSDATPLLMNFYEKYYSRLEQTYKEIIDHDYIDIIVPLETSIINTGSIDFITQLASYCQNFHNKTGFIQIGVIGSRNNGINVEDIATFKNDTRFTLKYTMLSSTQEILGDMGRFIMPVYGEVVMNHNFLNITYTSSASASAAGLLSSTPVNRSLIRSRLLPVFGISGVNLSQLQVEELERLGINTVVKGVRSRRGSIADIYLTNDHSMASKSSVYNKIHQIRLVSMIINEIISLGNRSTSKFSAQALISDVKQTLQFLKKNTIIMDYSLEAYSDQSVKGKVYFDISITSVMSLRKVSFSISSGQGA